MRANLTGAELNAAPLEGAHQENPAAFMGFAARRQKPRLPSRVCRIVLAQGSAACAGARYDLRGHGGCGWHGRRGKLGIGAGHKSGAAWLQERLGR